MAILSPTYVKPRQSILLYSNTDFNNNLRKFEIQNRRMIERLVTYHMMPHCSVTRRLKVRLL